MKNTDSGQPALAEPEHVGCGNSASLAATIEGTPPQLKDAVTEDLKSRSIARNRMIEKVAVDDAPEPLPQLMDWLVHPRAEFNPNPD